MSTHNMCFLGVIRKIFTWICFLFRAMDNLYFHEEIRKTSGYISFHLQHFITDSPLSGKLLLLFTVTSRVRFYFGQLPIFIPPSRARGYKTFFMLNSAEHEICFVYKS